MSPCWERNWPWWLKEACLHCLTKSLLFVVGQHEEDLSSSHSFLMSCEIASSVRTFKAQRKMSDIDEMFSLFYRVVEKSSNKIVSYSSKWKFKVQSWRLFKISFFFQKLPNRDQLIFDVVGFELWALLCFYNISNGGWERDSCECDKWWNALFVEIGTQRCEWKKEVCLRVRDRESVNEVEKE